MMNIPGPDTLLLRAQQIFELQTRAMSAAGPSGIEDFLACLHDDITWRFPRGKYAGTHHGKDSFAEFFRYACAYFPAGLTFHLDNVLGDGREQVAFEFHDEGTTVDGQPYQANVTIVYSLRLDPASATFKLSGYREYFG